MRIKVTKNAQCGNVPIPANEYWTSLNAEAGEMTLSAGGKDLKIKALRRKLQVKTKTTSIQFYCGGGKTWSLIITTPKQGEWIALLTYIE